MASKPHSRRAKTHRAKAMRTSRGNHAVKKPAGIKPSRDKVRAYRKRMRAKGFRLVQMWLPDTRKPKFAAEAHRQSLLANRSPFAAEDQAWVDSMSNWKTD